ncbi:MAG: hypothetical protein NT155_02930 [Candidatus Staskawiczbacteria bacterium]|nr:hypothetical protein [Candidatus Staskawiczbacteria bacterium]
MSWLNKLIALTYNPKFRMPFFLSPFLGMIFGDIGTIIMIKMGFPNPKFAIPVFIAIGYFILWIIIMYVRLYNYIGEDGKLQKKTFVKNTQVYDRFRQEARKYDWMVKEIPKVPLLMDYGFTIKGVEQGVAFEIAMIDNFSNAGGFSERAVYIKTKKGENFEISPANAVKNQFVEANREDLNYLMRNNKYITKISFYKGQMAALIFDYIGMSSNVKEVVSRLIQISKSYDGLY